MDKYVVNKNLQILMTLRKLSSIRRFNTYPTIQQESVATHSFNTAILAHLIADEYNTWTKTHNASYHPYDNEHWCDEVCIEDVFKLALYHDIEECVMSDIPWTVKHYTDEVYEQLTSVAQSKLKKLYQDSTLDYQKRYNLMEVNSLEKIIVSVADTIDCALFVYNEYYLGNRLITHVLVNCLNILKRYDSWERIYNASPTLRAIIEELETLVDMLDKSIAPIGGVPMD